MTDRPTEPIREDHQLLARHLEDLDRLAERLKDAPGSDAVAQVVEVSHWLVTEVVPHSQMEEMALYPLVDYMVARHGRATDTMRREHVHIRRLIYQFQQVAQALKGDPQGKEYQSLADQARVLAHQLRALLTLHWEKEEEDYLELLDRSTTPVEVQNLLSRGQCSLEGDSHRRHDFAI